jgi:hypothetical protein
MTGPVLAAFVIPAVAFPALLLWIGLVYFANAHPRRVGSARAAGHEGGAHADAGSGQEDSAYARAGGGHERAAEETVHAGRHAA